MGKFQLLITVKTLPDGQHLVDLHGDLQLTATLAASALRSLSDNIMKSVSNTVLNQINEQDSIVAVFDVESAVKEIKLCDILKDLNHEN